MPFARIHLQNINTDDPAPLTIQVYLGPDRKPVPQFPYAGWWGIPSETEFCWLLVFKPNGDVVFGGDGDEERADRLSHMNIFDRPFELGAHYSMTHFEGSPPSEFVVTSISEMAD